MGKKEPRIIPELQDIQPEVWLEIERKVLLYAHKKYAFAQSKMGDSAINLNEIAHDVINDTKTGEKSAPPPGKDNKVDINELIGYLCMHVRKTVTELTKRRMRLVSINECNYGDSSDSETMYKKSINIYDSALITSAEGIDQKVLCTELHQMTLRLAGDDDNLRSIIDLFFSEAGIKPSDMSMVTGIPIKDIYNLTKRLRALIERLKGGLE